MSYHLAVTAVIAAVLLLRGIFRKHLSPRAIHALWLAVLLRMLLPVSLPVELAVLPPVEPPSQVSGEVLPTAGEQSLPQGSRPAAPVSPEVSVSQGPSESPKEQSSLKWEDIRRMGSLALALWFSCSGVFFWRSLHRNRKADGNVGVLRVYRTARLRSPCLAGPVPAVYLPEGRMDDGEREMILRHEYCHFLRLDPLWSLVRIGALCLFWYNPAVWLAAHYSKLDGELACDDAVCSRFTQEKRLFYANTLVNAVQTSSRFALPWGGSPMKERIRMLTEQRKRFGILAVLLSLIALCTVGCTVLEVKTVPKARQAAVTEEVAVPASSTKTEPPASTVKASLPPASVTLSATVSRPIQPPYGTAPEVFTTAPAVPEPTVAPPPSTQAPPHHVREQNAKGVDTITYYNGLNFSLKVPEGWIWNDETGCYSTPATEDLTSCGMGVRLEACLEKDIADYYDRGGTDMLWDQPIQGTTKTGERYLVYRSTQKTFCGYGLPGYEFNVYFSDPPLSLVLDITTTKATTREQALDFLESVVIPLVESVDFHRS